MTMLALVTIAYFDIAEGRSLFAVGKVARMEVSMTEYEKMIAGELIVTNDAEIVRRNREATRLWRVFSQTGTDDEPAWRKAMSALLPNAHPTAVVKPPFRCDFGTEIYLGEKAFVNFNCTILDGAKVTIGARTFVGPDCGIYTPEHPIDWQERNRGIERMKPVTIGEDCWIGEKVPISLCADDIHFEER